MWSALISGIGTIFSSWISLKKAKHEAEKERAMFQARAEADWDVEALRASKDSWKDEYLTFVLTAPLVVAWFNPEKAMKWVQFVQELPVWYNVILGGIVCASFGLRWYFKQQQFKVTK